MSRKTAKRKAPPNAPSKARKKAAAKKPARRRSWLWRLLRWPVRLVLWTLALAVLWVLSYRVIDPPGGIYMASEWWRLGAIQRDWRDMDRISPRLARSVMGAEDARFCDHSGFDLDAIRAALAANEGGGRLRGGSTISQQVAKNVFLWHRRSWVRKGLEAGFTVLIELTWSKRRIIEVYMNTVEFAPGVFGAEAAAQHHFGRPALALTPVQAARLAAVLPSPKTRSASKPNSAVQKRSRAIIAGANTLKAEGRDACIFD